MWSLCAQGGRFALAEWFGKPGQQSKKFQRTALRRDAAAASRAGKAALASSQETAAAALVPALTHEGREAGTPSKGSGLKQQARNAGVAGNAAKAARKLELDAEKVCFQALAGQSLKVAASSAALHALHQRRLTQHARCPSGE